MTHLVFQTSTDTTTPVEIVGVGVLGPSGRGGIPIEHAADLMVELQALDVDGSGRPNRTPMAGAPLRAAAEDWARRIPGVVVVEVADNRVDLLAAEVGGALEPTAHSAIPDPLTAAGQGYRQLYGAPEPTEPTTPVAIGGTTVREAEILSGIPPESRTLAVRADIDDLSSDALEHAVRQADIKGRSTMSADEKREALAEHLGITDTGGVA